MKKIFFAVLAFASTIQLLAQSDPVYIVFSSTNENVAKILTYTETNYETDTYRYVPRIYTIQNRTADYYFTFAYLNKLDELDNPIINKTISFLNTISYIDWDIIGPNLTKAQAEARHDEILTHSLIYFIDRNEVINNTIKLVPVRPVLFGDASIID